MSGLSPAGGYLSLGHRDGTRPGDADRDCAVTVIGQAYAAGRLTQEQYTARLADIFAADSADVLAMIVRDLPEAHRGETARADAALHRATVRWHLLYGSIQAGMFAVIALSWALPITLGVRMATSGWTVLAVMLTVIGGICTSVNISEWVSGRPRKKTR